MIGTFTERHKSKGKVAVCGMLAASIAISVFGAAPAFAANGVQEGTQAYTSQSTSWNGDGRGDIDLSYEVNNWDEPGADPSVADDNVNHEGGTYVVTIPIAISYSGMKAGSVGTSDDYTVNVRGALAPGKHVTLVAETGKTLVNGSRTSDIAETTHQGKTSWSDTECFGSLNPDGSLSGTDCIDNIKLTGIAKAAGVYTGSVAYTARLE